MKKLPATMGLLWHPWYQRTRKSLKQDFGWEGVEGDKDSNGNDADLILRDEERGPRLCQTRIHCRLRRIVTSLATTHLMVKRIQRLCL